MKTANRTTTTETTTTTGRNAGRVGTAGGPVDHVTQTAESIETVADEYATEADRSARVDATTDGRPLNTGHTVRPTVGTYARNAAGTLRPVEAVTVRPPERPGAPVEYAVRLTGGRSFVVHRTFPVRVVRPSETRRA